MEQNRSAPEARLITLQDLICRLAGHGDKPAMVAVREENVDSWSYRTLDDRVTRLAGGLVKAGLSRGETVALLAGSRPEWILACLAVIRAGGVAVPLDAQLSDSGLRRVVIDSNPRFIFTTGKKFPRLHAIFNNTELRPIFLDAEANDQRSWLHLLSASRIPLPELKSDEVATLFYTSGTTGSAKGVPLTHRNLVFQINTVIDAHFVTEADRILLPLPLHHVYPFVIGMLLPLALGLPITLPQSLTGPQILRAIRQGAVTAVIGVPRLYSALCAGIAMRVKSRPAATALLFDVSLSFSTWLRRYLGLRFGKLRSYPESFELPGSASCHRCP